MRDVPANNDDPLIGDLMLRDVQRDEELALMRRLILSMALDIPAEEMPDDECWLLSRILDERDR